MKTIAFISQKGGVGKSTLARALAVEAQKQKIKVLLADCDIQQATSYEWTKWRKENKITPFVESQVSNQVKEVWPLVDKYDLVIIDGPARTSQATKEIAEKADLVIQPVGASRDDLMPAVKEFNALKKEGIPTKKLLFILNHVGSKAEAEIGKEYLQEAGYSCLAVVLPEKVSFRLVQNEGKSITEVSYRALRKQTKKLVESILDYV